MPPNKKADRTCCICKKLFCCVECRKRHEKNKHAERELKCALCRSEKLPLQHFADEEFLYHVAANHLPLRCCLCRDEFTTSKNLESFGPCRWWQVRHQLSLISVRKKSLLGTPSPVSGCENKTKEQSAIDGDYNENFGNLTSPPELYRNTSTPMHVGLVAQGSYHFKTPSVPSFSLKSSKIVSPPESIAESSGNSDADSDFVSFSPRDSKNQGCTPFRTASAARTNVMKEEEKSLQKMRSDERIQCVEIEADNLSDDMELTGVEGGILSESKNTQLHDKSERRSESIKRVRFSDEYGERDSMRRSTGSVTGINLTENEEYYEAHETLFEIKEHFDALPERSCDSSDVRICRENERNLEKENRSPDNVNTVVNQQTNPTQSSSRVVMMLVVENNSGFTTSDLKPLIDSGLRKLEQHTSNTASSTSASRVANYSDDSSPGNSRRSVTSMDTFFSVSSVECYSTPDATPSNLRDERLAVARNESASSTSGGIFSAVAHAVRFALKNFSGSSTKVIAREQVAQREESTARSYSPEPTANSTSSSILNRPGKRPRDVGESSMASRPLDPTQVPVDITSPLAKRHRGWYRIKGREPIARMRNSRITSPRGVSSETQVFSQGSLSVGDTVLPIPARAHQSTQTE